MAGLTGFDGFIGGIVGDPAGVTDFGVEHARHLAQQLFHTPKTPSG